MRKFSLTKGRGVFVVDLLLVPVFVFAAYSGLRLHTAGHVAEYVSEVSEYAVGGLSSHDIWEYWAHLHIIAAVLSLVLGWWHIKAHWGWYTGLFRRSGKRTFSTTILSVLFLVEILTGLYLVACVEGGNSGVGLWHYALGLAMTVFFLWHLLRRFSILLKGLRRRKPHSNG